MNRTVRILSACAFAALAAAAVLPMLRTGSASLPAVHAQERDPASRNFQTYRLRVDDEVEIVVYNVRNMTPEISRAIVVPASGDVSFPPVGKLTLLGRTAQEIEETVRQRIKDEGYLDAPVVGAFVRKYAPRTVAIVGASQGVVEMPTHRDLRILEVLARAGSLGEKTLDYSRVVIRRIGPDGKPFTVDINVDDILDRNQEEKNVVVREGDIVRLFELQSAVQQQSAEFVYVTGKIGSPGRHPLIRGRFPFTITKLIAVCGDFREFADTSKVRIIRITDTGRQFKEVDFEDIIEGKAPDFELRADDFIYVPERLF